MSKFDPLVFCWDRIHGSGYFTFKTWYHMVVHGVCRLLQQMLIVHKKACGRPSFCPLQSVWSCCCLLDHPPMCRTKTDSHLCTWLLPTVTAGELLFPCSGARSCYRYDRDEHWSQHQRPPSSRMGMGMGMAVGEWGVWCPGPAGECAVL